MTTHQVLPAILGGAPAEVIDAYVKLSPKRRQFALELSTAASASEAARKAGFTDAHAYRKCSELANDPRVKLVSAWLVDAALRNGAITIERLMKEIAAIAFSDPRQVMTAMGSLLSPCDWPEESARAISSVEIDEIFENDAKGKREHVGYTKKVKFWDKLGGIEKALKLLSAYPAPKKVEPPSAGNTYVGVVIVPQRSETAGHPPAKHQPIDVTPGPGGYTRLDPTPALRTSETPRAVR